MILESVHEDLIGYFSSRVKLDSTAIDLIKKLYEPKIIKKKEFLFEQGQLCRIEAFVIDGSAKVFYSDEKGNEHILYFAFKDWWIGDIASFNFGEQATMSAQALEDLYLLTINFESKEELFSKVPQMERMFRIITQRTLTVLQKRFFLAMSGSSRDRYLQLIERHPKIEQLVPQYQIASYLGILPESLSRMKKQLYV
ncbi:MAG: Crp/Fnr family transcriptional regulator [Bacteroidota bacterium]